MCEKMSDTLKRAYKPFDIVTDIDNNVGYINEVSINENQDRFETQVSYSVVWIIGKGDKCAWYYHEELRSHTNMLAEIARAACQTHGQNAKWVDKLMGL